MTIAKDKTRKEVHLREDVLNTLTAKAEKDGRTLKNLMEFVLIEYAKSLTQTNS